MTDEHLKKTAGCTHQGVPVREGLDFLRAYASDDVVDAIKDRLIGGEKKYGHVLAVGWNRARIELYQELLDAVAYAIAAGEDGLSVTIVELAETVRDLCLMYGDLDQMGDANDSTP